MTMKNDVLCYSDFLKLKSRFYGNDPEFFQKRKKDFIESGESAEILPYCLR
jgi:hypothetical protein